MKRLNKVLLVAFFSICSLQIANAQSKQEVIKIVTSGKWGMYAMEQDGKKINVNPGGKLSNDSWSIYKADGTYTGVEYGEKNNGKWSYDEKTKGFTLENEIDPKMTLTLDKITDEEIVLAMPHANVKIYVKKFK